MIRVFTGKPGNGKSYHIAMEIKKYLRKGKTVFSNVEINIDSIKPKRKKTLGNYFYIDSSKIGAFNDNPTHDNQSEFISGLYGYALNYHQRNKKGNLFEHQSLVIIDECQDNIILNARTWNMPNRSEINKFLQWHRHYGFDVILSTQNASNIDKQALKVVQCEEEHRKLSMYKLFGKIITFIMGSEIFVVIKRDLSLKRSPKMARMGAYYIYGNKSIYNIYNSNVVTDFRR